MVKTIKESSEVLGISTQAIYKRIKNMDDSQQAVFLTTDENGIRMLTEEGLEFIGGDRKEGPANTIEEKKATDQQDDKQGQQLVTWLQAEITKLNDELKIERENSRDLTRQLIKITENQQALLGHNMGMKQIENQGTTQEIADKTTVIKKTEEVSQSAPGMEAEEAEKSVESKGFLSRLFKK